MSGGDDLYSLLGVKPTATAGDISDHFARLEGHADDRAQDAYDILRDPTRRRSYDDTRRARSDAVRAATSSDHRAAAGHSDVTLDLSFDQAALGTTATVHIDAPVPCSACSGSGAIAGTGCIECSGVGFHVRTSGGIKIRTECRTCEGTGRAAPTSCEPCSGRGAVEATRAVTIRVPAGVGDGARLRFTVPDGSSHTQRHAVVRVAPHPYFTRDGHDLRIQLPLTLAEAALGATVTVPTLGGAVAIRIPPGTQGGRTFRLRGRGIPAESGAGDLLATVEVTIPSDLTDQQRQALETFAAATPPPRQHFTSPETSGSKQHRP